MKRFHKDPDPVKLASEMTAIEVIDHMQKTIDARGREIAELQSMVESLMDAPIMEHPVRVAMAIKATNDQLDKMDLNVGLPLPKVLTEKFKALTKSIKELNGVDRTLVYGHLSELEVLYASFFHFPPASYWRVLKEEDPFVDYLTKGRAALTGGHFSDDHIANQQFLYGIAWQTMAKERIRFLSRAAIELQEKVGLLTQELSGRLPKKLFVNLETGVVREQSEISEDDILRQGELYLRNMKERKIDIGAILDIPSGKTILASELSQLPATEVPKPTEAWMKFQQGEDAVAAMLYPPLTKLKLSPEFLKKNICESCSFNPDLKNEPDTGGDFPDSHPV